MASSVLERTDRILAVLADQPARRRQWSWDRVLPWLVLVSAVGLAAVHYLQFLEVHRYLWDSGAHDRNAHYLFILKLAADLRNGNLPHFLKELDTARVWGPLQDGLAALVVAASRRDYRIAVLPSLAGWVMAVAFAFLLARRVVPRGGNLAGLAAALFVVVSPSYKAYAADVMLESLGAGLTLAALYCYVVVVQEGGIRAGRRLGLALTLLFLHKTNYWLLAMLSITACSVAASPLLVLQKATEVAAGWNWRQWARDQIRQPLTYVLAGLVAAIVAIFSQGDHSIELLGRAFVFYPPHNVIHVAFVVFVMRLWPWWQRAGREQVAQLVPPWQQLIRWHVYALVAWFLLPKRLGSFLWYMSPYNAGDAQQANLRQGLIDYCQWAVADYHVALWSALLAAALVGVSILTRRQLRPGGTVVLWLLFLALALAANHPNRKARNLHSWIAAGWVAAAAGLVVLTHGRWTARTPGIQPWLGAAVLGGLVAAHGSGLVSAGVSPEGGPHPDRPSFRDLTDAVAPDFDAAPRFAVLTMDILKPLVQWMILERYGSLDRLEPHWFGFGDDKVDNRQGFQRWLAAPTVNTLVVFDQPVGLPLGNLAPVGRLHSELRDLLATQQTFHLTRRQDFPRHGIEVQVWQRAPQQRPPE